MATGYHERTKHAFGRFAPGPGRMDWATQPSPYRSFEGAEQVPLAFPARDTTPPYHWMYEARVEPAPLTAASLSSLLYYSMALAAEKRAGGDAWQLRVNPSSGNLHPTECYVLVPPLEGVGKEPGVYHYAPATHALERRAAVPLERWAPHFGPSGLPSGAFLVGLSSIYWREAWKYGERAYRYCNHDTGHALAALRLSAGMLGWGLRVLGSLLDDDVASALGTDRARDFREHEREEPELLAVVYPSGPPEPDLGRFAREDAAAAGLAEDARAEGRWAGAANELTRPGGHHPWPAIDIVADACRKPRTAPLAPPPGPAEPSRGLHAPPGVSAGHIARTRRSVWRMDKRTSMPAPAFFACLARTVPGALVRRPPFDAQLGAWPVLVPLLIVFVHRVDGIPSGLYALLRDPAYEEAARGLLRPTDFVRRHLGRDEFEWTPVEGAAAAGAPLFRLAAANFEAVSERVSCDQDIASDGCFSLGMLARLAPALREIGVHAYRLLFWEAGAVGQVLYLEAEAAGLRGTGMGCYFDDPVHGVFGVRGDGLQSVYHFAVGAGETDSRLQTSDPYRSLRAGR
eukprot:tig00000658_g2921.t1